MKKVTEEAVARGFVLQGFDKVTDELRVELHLSPVPIDRLRALFDVRNDPDMYDAYRLDATKADALASLVSEPIDTRKYEFFLQRYA